MAYWSQIPLKAFKKLPSFHFPARLCVSVYQTLDDTSPQQLYIIHICAPRHDGVARTSAALMAPVRRDQNAMFSSLSSFHTPAKPLITWSICGICAGEQQYQISDGQREVRIFQGREGSRRNKNIKSLTSTHTDINP